MYRFLIATMPLTGHFTPMVGIARQLVERGHEVWWYTGKHFQAKVEATGARFVSMKAAYDFVETDLSRAFPGREKLKDFGQLKFDLKHLFIDDIPRQYQDLTDILKEFPADVLIADTGCLGPRSVWEKGGPPWAAIGITALTIASQDTAPFGLGLLPSSSRLGQARNRLLYALLKKVLFRDVSKHLNRVRAGIGLVAFKGSVYDMPLSSYLYIQGTTEAFEYPRRDLPSQVHFVGPFLPDPASSFSPPPWWPELVNSTRPVVYVTQGTWATGAEQLIVPTLKALAREDVLVIATTGGRSVEALGLEKIPDNARLERFIPHHDLLPHISLMITNAGYGGVQQALAHGVPLIAAGNTEEKPEICNRVEWSGVGLNLKTKSPKPSQIQKAVKKVLTNPRYQEKARQIQADFARHQAAGAAADLLEQLAHTRQPVIRSKQLGALTRVG